MLLKTRASLAAWILALTLAPAAAQEFKPYPRANITTDQWQTYFDEVKSKHGADAKDLDDQKLLLFDDKATATMFAFTKPGHPAHPAWITRKLEQRNNNLYVAQIGYFAGAEAPFAELFRAYIALNEKMKEAARRANTEAVKKD
jgi:hypothetical protein